MKHTREGSAVAGPFSLKYPWSAWLGSLVVAAIAIGSSITGILNDLAQDDIPLIVNDARVHGLGAIGQIFTTAYWPPPFSAELYRPLTTLLMAIEYTLGSGAPIVFRVASYVLYAIVSIGMLWLCRRLMPPALAIAMAAIFAAHPVHVEAVAIAVNQAELLVALFSLIAVIWYVDARRRDVPTRREWCVIAACCAAAALSKETGFVLPALILVAELLLATRRTSEEARRVALGIGALFVLDVLIFTLRAHVLAGSVGGSFVAEALVGRSVGVRVMTMLSVVPRWARLFVWPEHLQLDYSPNEIVASTSMGGLEWFGLAIVVAGFVSLALTWRRAPVVAFGLAWAIIALAPVSNLVIPTGVVLAERTLFLPSIGYIVACGGLIALLFGHRVARRGDRAIAIPIFFAVVAMDVSRSAWRQRDFLNDWILWARTARDAPLSYRAQRAYAEVLVQIGQKALAIDAYQKSIAAAPSPWLIQNELAARLRDMGDDSLASVYLRASLAQRPAQPEARAELVAALIGLGHYDEASREASAAIAASETPSIFERLRATADSAEKAHAPVGSVRLRVNQTPIRASIPR